MNLLVCHKLEKVGKHSTRVKIVTRSAESDDEQPIISEPMLPTEFLELDGTKIKYFFYLDNNLNRKFMLSPT